jgi:putative ABC transport system substrate-binding protein
LISSTFFLLLALLVSSDLIPDAMAKDRLPVVGVLSFFGKSHDSAWDRLGVQPFRESLAEQGWIEGKTVRLEFADANGDPELFAKAAEKLVDRKVDIIMAYSAPALRAAFAATRTIPIVGADLTTEPIAEGYVQSYARPGGNVTGLFLDAPEFAGKWFELLKHLEPELSRVAVLWDPAPGTNHLDAVRSVAGSLNIMLQILEVREPGDIDAAFSAMSRKTQAVVILPSPMNFWQSARLAELALKYRLPATSMALEFSNAGGMISYGLDTTPVFQRSAAIVSKILNGAKAGNVPVERPLEIRLVVNAKTARLLGIAIPQSIALRADEMIR